MPVVTLRDESKRQGDFYVPRYEIKIAGANLPQNVLRDVLQVTYNDNIKELDSFELTVNNWDAEKRRISNMWGRKRPIRWQRTRSIGSSIHGVTMSKCIWGTAENFR